MLRIRKGLFKLKTEPSTYQLYDTIIYRHDTESDTVELNSGGWLTKHTKNCINDLIVPFDWHLIQTKGEWLLTTIEGQIHTFSNFMKINVKTGQLIKTKDKL